MDEGFIKWLSNRKPFGFIQQSDGNDIFFLFYEVDGPDVDSLSVGDKVTFEFKDGPKGPEAINIKKNS